MNTALLESFWTVTTEFINTMAYILYDTHTWNCCTPFPISFKEMCLNSTYHFCKEEKTASVKCEILFTIEIF